MRITSVFAVLLKKSLLYAHIFISILCVFCQLYVFLFRLQISYRHISKQPRWSAWYSYLPHKKLLMTWHKKITVMTLWKNLFADFNPIRYEQCIYFGNFAYVHGFKYEDLDYGEDHIIIKNTKKNPDYLRSRKNIIHVKKLLYW